MVSHWRTVKSLPILLVKSCFRMEKQNTIEILHYYFDFLIAVDTPVSISFSLPKIFKNCQNLADATDMHA